METGDFFIPTNSVSDITDKDYENIDFVIEMVKAFERSTYQCVYIIDYHKQDFLYVSRNLVYWCGVPAEQIQEFGYNFYINYVPEEDLKMLLEVNRKGFAKFNDFPVHERKDYIISYDFHIKHGRKYKLVNHKITPLFLTKEGRIWLALCTISLSSRNCSGQIVMKKPYEKGFYEYSLAKHEWEYQEGITLTDTEREVLTLSTQGLTMVDIAGKLCKSVDTIKACKRTLFAKLDVKNIAEALTFAENHKLL